jgi:hypothetical protein
MQADAAVRAILKNVEKKTFNFFQALVSSIS